MKNSPSAQPAKQSIAQYIEEAENFLLVRDRNSEQEDNASANNDTSDQEDVSIHNPQCDDELTTLLAGLQAVAERINGNITEEDAIAIFSIGKRLTGIQEHIKEPPNHYLTRILIIARVSGFRDRVKRRVA